MSRYTKQKILVIEDTAKMLGEKFNESTKKNKKLRKKRKKKKGAKQNLSGRITEGK